CPWNAGWRGVDRNRLELPREREEPHAIAFAPAAKERAGRKHRDVLVPFVLKGARRGIDTGVGHELPQLLAIRLIERHEAPVTASREHQSAGRVHRAAEARLIPG